MLGLCPASFLVGVTMAWTDIATRVQKAGQRVFGEVVTFTPSGGTPQTGTGIFDAAHVYQEIIGDTVVETVRPVVVVRSDSFSPDPKRNDAITVRSKNYICIEMRPDGQGDLEISLEET